MPDIRWEIIGQGLPLMLRGLQYTLLLAAAGFGFGLLGGTTLAVLRHEVRGWAGKLASGYIDLIRGIPLILFLVFIHYGLMPMINERTDFLVSSIIAFSLFESAYLAEIIRSGLQSVREPERDAARSLGLSRKQALMLVIFPLAARRMAPALVNQLVTLIKDTSLASIVGVIELTRAGEIIYEQSYRDFEILTFVALVYFVICYGLSRLSRRIAPA